MSSSPLDDVRVRSPWNLFAKTRLFSGVGLTVDSIIAHPAQLFWIFAGAHLFLWTLIPALTSPNAPLDVIEGYAWGREWLLGTYKHPPMQAWWLEVLAFLTGRAHWAHFFASQIAVVTAFWAVWKMGLRIMSPREALVSALLLEGIVYYNFTSPEFNPNVLQLPFWALIGLFFHRAVKDNRLTDWLLLGAWSACGLYTKYSTGLLLVVLALLMILHPEGRQRLKQKGPYAAVALAAALFLPHLVWLLHTDFIPIEYVVSRIANPATDTRHLAQPLQFLMSQLLAILLMLVLLLMMTPRHFFFPAKAKDRSISSFDRHFLQTMAFGPLLILLLVSSLGVKVHDMWGTPLWGYTSLWIINRSDAVFTARVMKRFTYGWAATFFITLVAYGGVNILYPYFSHNVQRVHFPGQTLANAIKDGWHARVAAPLMYVAGDTWLAGNIAYYTSERPHVFIRGDYHISPWIAPEEVKKHGAILTWCIANCGCHNFAEAKPDFVSQYPQAEIKTPLVLKRQTGADVEPVTVGWAIVPPAEVQRAEAKIFPE